MRGGVLADSAPASRISHPHDFLSNERHLGMPHIETMPRARRAKRPYRATRKPRSWILAHHDLAQMLSPMNPTQHLEAFARQAAAAANPQPTQTYQGAVQAFYDSHPGYESVVPMETAYFFEKSGLDPNSDQFFNMFHTSNQYGTFLNKHARADLKDVVELVGSRTDRADRPRLQELYAQASAPFHSAGSSGLFDKTSPVKDELFDRDPYSPYSK